MFYKETRHPVGFGDDGQDVRFPGQLIKDYDAGSFSISTRCKLDNLIYDYNFSINNFSIT